MFHWMQPRDKKVSCLFASSGFPLEKGLRRNKKESSFLKDLAEILKTGIFGFDSYPSRIVFLLHRLVKKQKMWDTFFCQKKRKKQQLMLIWLEMAFCCPKPLFEQQVAASRAALARVPLRLGPQSPTATGASRPAMLHIIPVPCCASSGARPHPLLPLPAPAAPRCGGRVFPPKPNRLDASWDCWRVSSGSGDAGTAATPHGSGCCEPNSAGRCGSQRQLSYG